MNQLNKEPDEPHDQKSYSSGFRDTGKFWSEYNDLLEVFFHKELFN